MEKNELIQSGLLEEYVLGLSSPEEKSLVERMAEEHDDIAHLISDMRGAMDNYCHRLKGPSPSMAKRRMLNKIARHSDPETTARVTHLSVEEKPFMWPKTAIVLVSAVGIILSMSAFYWWLGKDIRSEMKNVARERDELLLKHESLNEKYDETSGLLSLVRDQNTLQVRLSGTDISPHACATLYVNANDRTAALSLIELPELPNGMIYHVWIEQKGTHKLVGTLDSCTQRWMHLPFIHPLDGIHLTAENGEKNVTSPSEKSTVIVGHL